MEGNSPSRTVRQMVKDMMAKVPRWAKLERVQNAMDAARKAREAKGSYKRQQRAKGYGPRGRQRRTRTSPKQRGTYAPTMPLAAVVRLNRVAVRNGWLPMMMARVNHKLRRNRLNKRVDQLAYKW